MRNSDEICSESCARKFENELNIGVRRRKTSKNLRKTSQISYFCILFAAISTFSQPAQAYPSLMILPNGIVAPSSSFYSVPSLVPSSRSKKSNLISRTNQNNVEHLSARKRAFDRLDVSPFDFEALSKRFNDDDDVFYGRRRRAFDRLDDNEYMGLMSRKRRAFDRLEDGPFLLGKRAQHQLSDFADTQPQSQQRIVQKRPFDRLEGSTFGIDKRTQRQNAATHNNNKMTIADVLQRFNNNDGGETNEI